jgi:UDP-N-acetylglucosamine 2-epimerase (non-hydrolysing)
MKNIMLSLKQLALEFSDVLIIYPVHLNPVIKDLASEVLSDIENILLIDPLDVFDMHNLMNKSFFVLTTQADFKKRLRL